jgi:predicted PolB exonuclease-like 3'-5' exonuclease
MIERTLIAFDIETIPDPDLGRRVFGYQGNDEAVVAAMLEQRLAETDGRSDFPQLPHHRIVCVCAACLEPDEGRFGLRALGGCAMDERSHLEGFFGLFRRPGSSPRIISWNGGGFDLPVIRYRSMLRGVAAPEFYCSDGARRSNHYNNRFHDLHTDLMDVLSGYGGSMRVGLGTLGRVLGLSGKAFLERSIYEHIFRGEEETVREYCKFDVLETLLLYLRWAHHCGKLSTERLCELVRVIRSIVEKQSFAGWQQIAAGLERWPEWAWGEAPTLTRVAYG